MVEMGWKGKRGALWWDSGYWGRVEGYVYIDRERVAQMHMIHVKGMRLA